MGGTWRYGEAWGGSPVDLVHCSQLLSAHIISHPQWHLPDFNPSSTPMCPGVTFCIGGTKYRIRWGPTATGWGFEGPFVSDICASVFIEA